MLGNIKDFLKYLTNYLIFEIIKITTLFRIKEVKI